MTETPEDATAILTLASRGDERAAERLTPLVYDELRRIADRSLRRERRDHTLQPTALVNEVFVKLVDQSRLDVAGRTHFLAIAARGMRQVLIDHARVHNAQKRGGGYRRVDLEDASDLSDSGPIDALVLEEALEDLGQLDERSRQVVVLRFFGGLTSEEVAEHLGVSLTTVQGVWRHARAWLHHRLAGNPEA